MKFLWIFFAFSMLYAEEESSVFAGGCFWCLQSDFDKLNGVLTTTVGYEGGDLPNPTYQEVSTGLSGYVEAIEVIFDNEIVTYSELLDFYWHHIDPTNRLGQFCDIGPQYRPVIFTRTETQNSLAQIYSIEILPAKTFYPAEEYHQKYYLKNPLRYQFYRKACGRDRRLAELWGN